MWPLGMWLALITILAGAGSAVRAQIITADFARYRLDEPSAITASCRAPCDCAVRQAPMRGRFELRLTGSDPHGDTYDVVGLKCTVSDEARSHQLTGGGTYRVRRGVEAVQEMSLDLSIDGRPPLRFESGRVSGGRTFPNIDVALALRAQSACTDSMIHVAATPELSEIENGWTLRTERARNAVAGIVGGRTHPTLVAHRPR